MPQARLPDIDHAYTKYRNEVIGALKKKYYNVMHGGLVALNALLPDEYRVIISTSQYNQLTKTDTVYPCTHCKEEILKEDVRIFLLPPSSVESLLYGATPSKVWGCPKCAQINKLQLTDISREHLRNPSFLGIVPDPPERKGGLMNRMNFHIETERWVWLHLGELEAKMAKFRDDNWNKNDGEDDLDIDTSIEEEA